MGLYFVESSSSLPNPHHLIVLLHGRGADEKDLLPVGDFFSQHCHIVSVRAPLRLGAGYAWYGDSSDTSMMTKDISHGVQELEQLLVRFHLPIIVMGFSQGGLMAARFAMTTSLGVAGVASLSAPPLDQSMVEDEARPGMRVFWAHGTHDPVVPLNRGEMTLKQLKKVWGQVTERRYAMAHTISDEEIIDLRQWLQDFVDQP